MQTVFTFNVPGIPAAPIPSLPQSLPRLLQNASRNAEPIWEGKTHFEMGVCPFGPSKMRPPISECESAISKCNFPFEIRPFFLECLFRFEMRFPSWTTSSPIARAHCEMPPLIRKRAPEMPCLAGLAARRCDSSGGGEIEEPRDPGSTAPTDTRTKLSQGCIPLHRHDVESGTIWPGGSALNVDLHQGRSSRSRSTSQGAVPWSFASSPCAEMQ